MKLNKFPFNVSSQLLLICLIASGVGLAHADIRDDISKLKVDIDAAQKNLIEINVDILKQKQTIADNKDNYEAAEKHEKTLRGSLGSSWESVAKHEQSIIDVGKAETKYRDSEKALVILFDQRSIIIRNIDAMENQLKKIDVPSAPRPQNGLIGITIDNTCKAYLKNNLTTVCPTFELLDAMYPASPCDLSGKGCSDYYRQIGGFHYFIDPPAEVMERIKMITIRSSFEEFHLQGSAGYTNINHTINYIIGRHVDSCKDAYIGSDSWLEYIGDTIYYLHKNCGKQYTNLNELRHVEINQTVHDITTSYKYQLEKWIAESKEKCINKCFEY